MFGRDGVNGFSLCFSTSAHDHNAQIFSARTEVTTQMKVKRGGRIETLVVAVKI